VGEGATIGGRVAHAIDPMALARLAAGRRVVLVTGTNGKTTTAHFLAAALRSRGRVACNDSGANMTDGALTALLEDRSAPEAVLEVDELHLAEVGAATRPELVVLLNLSRDQLDRSTEVAAVAARIRTALLALPRVRVLANADDPVITSVATGLVNVQWFAGGCTWAEDSALCPRCRQPLRHSGADWGCTTCGLHRPDRGWALSGNVIRGPDGRATSLTVRLPGTHNARNALAAVAAAASLDVHPDTAADAVARVRSVAHRYATVDHGDHRLTLLLAKNPAGWRETLRLAGRFSGLLLVVNAREPDGRDTSWLWDVSFDGLPSRPLAVSGESAEDLGLRLTYAGVPHTARADPLEALADLPPGDIGVLANYTAFTRLWHRLAGSP
jgi:lipid II isoglutaminyl synthase (glutamine-hydrolysing)